MHAVFVTDPTAIVVGIGWAVVSSSRNQLTLTGMPGTTHGAQAFATGPRKQLCSCAAGSNVAAYDWFLDRDDSGGRRCRPTYRLSTTTTPNTYQVGAPANSVYSVCMCPRGSANTCFGQRLVPRIYFYGVSSQAAPHLPLG
jgi:hypothetical protein